MKLLKLLYVRAVPAVLLSAVALCAQTAHTVEERLRAIEQQVQTLAKENTDLK